MWSLKSSLDEKLSVTNEQKKVLIKEVKTLRKKVEDVNSSNDTFRTVNGNLETAILELQKQLDSQRARFETLLSEANSKSSSIESQEEKRDSQPLDPMNRLETTTNDLVQNALRASSEAKHHKGSTSIDSENDLIAESKSLSEDSRTSRQGSVANPVSTSILPPPPLPVDLDGNVIEWDHETRQQMLQMDWLSPEQRALLQDRQKEDLPFAESADHQSLGRKRSIVQMTSTLFHLDKSEKHSSEGIDAASSLAVSEKQEHEESKISFRRLSALFHSSSQPQSTTGESHPSSPPTVAIKAEDPTPPSSPSPGHELINPDTHSDDRNRRSSSAAPIPTCYRCGGTVEGPKYSTCKCDIPQMTPLVEESAIDHFKGFFSKGKNAAKKAGSAVTSSLLKGRTEENHLSDSQHLPSSPPAYLNAISSPKSPSTGSLSSSSQGTKPILNLLPLEEPTQPPAATEANTSPESSIAQESSNDIASTSSS